MLQLSPLENIKQQLREQHRSRENKKNQFMRYRVFELEKRNKIHPKALDNEISLKFKDIIQFNRG